MGVRVKKAKDVTSNGEWLLTLNKMATLMANIRKFVNQIPIEKDVNSKLEVLWHAKGTLMENLTPSLMAHQIGTPKSKFIKIIMAH